jgi:hypothetical protein
METERILHRDKMYSLHTQSAENNKWADCIITNKRLVLFWEHGTIVQYYLKEIRRIYLTEETSAPNLPSGRVKPILIHLTDQTHIYYISPDTEQLLSKIRDALMPT